MVELIKTHKGTVYAQRNGVLIPVNTDGLVGYWPMTQGSGLTVYDESKTGNTGTIYGPVWTNTANGKALDFDGTDDYVEAPDDSSLEGMNELSIVMWVNPDAFADYDGLINKGDWGDSYKAHTSGDGDIYFGYSALDKVKALGVLLIGSWQMIVLWFDGTEWRVYSGNAVLEANVSAVANSILDTATKLRLGKNKVNYFNGKIDEVRIYDKALSSQEITNIYEKTRGLYNV